MNSIATPHGAIPLPIYLPDATRGVVRSVDSRDLEQVGISALVMNVFHLMQTPGSSTIQALGGLHRMADWHAPIITDSGGFQIYSLIHQKKAQGSLNNKGAQFSINGRKFALTPEKSIQLQLSYGADVLFCLDDCTHPDAPHEEQRASVQRTIAWAKRCKTEFERLIDAKKLSPDQRPRLFAVIQGGKDPALRRQCAEALLPLGFDGYGYGGYPVDNEGRLTEDVFAQVRELVPPEYPIHALGLGHPQHVATVYRLGYGLFDSAMPTRDARRGRLYVFNHDSLRDDWFSTIYIADKKHIKSDERLCPHTPGWVDERYTRGYLQHLFSVKETVAWRLATLHNLAFMGRVMELLREDGR